MDDKKEGLLLIATAMIVLLAFAITVLAVMIIYRKRKIEHLREIDAMNEKFSHELLMTQVEAQRETMQYIGREIHDNVGQKLTLAVLYAQQVETGNMTTQGSIDHIAQLIHESLADLRALSRSLTNTQYLENDLDVLISNECSRIEATRLCKVTFETDNRGIDASEAVKIFIVRIVQEFIQNSLRHASCSLICVRLQQEEGMLKIYVSDNGIGFLINENVPPGKGAGLSNMKKRAEIINAAFTIRSIPGKGTDMELLMPLNKLNS
jgi:signal transduction histidine kinase